MSPSMQSLCVVKQINSSLINGVLLHFYSCKHRNNLLVGLPKNEVFCLLFVQFKKKKKNHISQEVELLLQKDLAAILGGKKKFTSTRLESFCHYGSSS